MSMWRFVLKCWCFGVWHFIKFADSGVHVAICNEYGLQTVLQHLFRCGTSDKHHPGPKRFTDWIREPRQSTNACAHNHIGVYAYPFFSRVDGMTGMPNEFLLTYNEIQHCTNAAASDIFLFFKYVCVCVFCTMAFDVRRQKPR